jgi:dihydrolipoamide dehydrogenase
MSDKKHDLIVIGAGPGGYIAAIRAAQLGLDTACVEENAELGGTCLRVGCIPSKALLESSHRYHAVRHEYESHGVKVGGVELDLAAMLKRKDRIVSQLTRGVASLFKKYNVTRYEGRGRLDGPGKAVVQVSETQSFAREAKHIILAAGSVSSPLPGVELDGDRIGTSTEALSYPEVPGHLVVIGAGYIGLELGSVWARLGAKVTVLEYLDRILPGMDRELSEEALRVFKKQGIKFQLSTKVTGARAVNRSKCLVEVSGADPVECDRVLLCVGRRPNSADLGLDTVGITPDKAGRIPVDENWSTTAKNVYAIGDLIQGPMLAHKAEEEGAACAEYIARGYGHVNYAAIPGVVYTHPEVASVGRTEDDLKASGVPYKSGKAAYFPNGRAKALGESDGFVKILAHADTDRILGVHIIGAQAGDLIAEAAAAINFGATAEDLAHTSHAHPSLAEVVKEAALAAFDKPLNS